MSSLERLAITALLAALGLALAPAAATAEASGGSLFGFGLGPSVRLGGPLAAIYTGDGVTGRIRMGGRAGHIGFELTNTIAPLGGGELERPTLLLVTPSLAYYPWDRPRAQLSVRGGLGFGEIVGDLVGPAPPCLDEPPCPGPTVETVGHAAFGLELGATAQLHLGRRRGGRAIVSVDVGVALLRVQLAEQVIAGRALFITFGVAHGMAF